MRKCGSLTRIHVPHIIIYNKISDLVLHIYIFHKRTASKLQCLRVQTFTLSGLTIPPWSGGQSKYRFPFTLRKKAVYIKAAANITNIRSWRSHTCHHVFPKVHHTELQPKNQVQEFRPAPQIWRPLSSPLVQLDIYPPPFYQGKENLTVNYEFRQKKKKNWILIKFET